MLIAEVFNDSNQRREFHLGQNSIGWDLKQSDLHFLVDLEGNNSKKLVLVNLSSKKIGYCKYHINTLEMEWFGHNIIRDPDALAQGWELDGEEIFLIGDVTGDEKEEIFVSLEGKVGIFILGNDKALRCPLMINQAGGYYNADTWVFQKGDRFYIADLDDDPTKEIIVLNTISKKIGILKWINNSFKCIYQVDGIIPNIQDLGVGGWQYRSKDDLFFGDFIGDGSDEIFIKSNDYSYHAHETKLAGVIKYANKKLKLIWYSEGWIPQEGSEARGWLLSKGDKIYIGDIINDSKREIILINHFGTTIGIVSWKNQGLNVTWMKSGWLLPSEKAQEDGMQGWELSRNSDYYIGKIIDINNDNLITYRHDTQQLGLIIWESKQLKIRWIGYDYINSILNTSTDGWDLQENDIFLIGSMDDSLGEEIISISEEGENIGVNKWAKYYVLNSCNYFDRIPGYGDFDQGICISLGQMVTDFGFAKKVIIHPHPNPNLKWGVVTFIDYTTIHEEDTFLPIPNNQYVTKTLDFSTGQIEIDDILSITDAFTPATLRIWYFILPVQLIKLSSYIQPFLDTIQPYITSDIIKNISIIFSPAMWPSNLPLQIVLNIWLDIKKVVRTYNAVIKYRIRIINDPPNLISTEVVKLFAVEECILKNYILRKLREYTAGTEELVKTEFDKFFENNDPNNSIWVLIGGVSKTHWYKGRFQNELYLCSLF